MISFETHYVDAVRAVESGDERYKTIVALFKLTGREGVEVDADYAVALLEERSSAGDPEAKWILGLCCEYGFGTDQDSERAKSLYSQSGDARNSVGIFLSENGDEDREIGVMNVKPWSL